MAKTLVTFRLLVEAPDITNQLEAAMRQTLDTAVRSMRVYNFKTLGKESSFGKPSKDESIRLTPRKVHFGGYSHAICHNDPYRTVPLSRLTRDWSKVTCKYCLKHKKSMTGQQELFT